MLNAFTYTNDTFTDMNQHLLPGWLNGKALALRASPALRVASSNLVPGAYYISYPNITDKFYFLPLQKYGFVFFYQNVGVKKKTK